MIKGGPHPARIANTLGVSIAEIDDALQRGYVPAALIATWASRSPRSWTTGRRTSDDHRA